MTWEDCKDCNGNGYITYDSNGASDHEYTCAKCQGSKMQKVRTPNQRLASELKDFIALIDRSKKDRNDWASVAPTLHVHARYMAEKYPKRIDIKWERDAYFGDVDCWVKVKGRIEKSKPETYKHEFDDVALF